MGDGLWVTYEFYDFEKELAKAKKREQEAQRVVKQSDQQL